MNYSKTLFLAMTGCMVNIVAMEQERKQITPLVTHPIRVQVPQSQSHNRCCILGALIACVGASFCLGSCCCAACQ